MASRWSARCGFLGKQRPMHIRADGGARHGPFTAVLAVVAKPLHDRGQRTRAGAQIGAAAVVLEPDQVRAFPPAGDVADATRHVGPRVNGLHVENAESPHHRAVGVAVGPAHQLIAAAHGQHGRAVGHVHPNAVGMPPRQALAGGSLLAVLTAADHVDVLRLVQRIAPGHRRHPQLDSAPGAAPLQTGHVAPVRIKIHQVRVEIGQSQRRSVGGHASLQ